MERIAHLCAEVIKGKSATREDAADLWERDLDALLLHANKVRRHFKGDRVNLCSIINAKSGACSEDCAFCAQSAHHGTDVPRYPLVDAKRITAAFNEAQNRGAGCFGIVTSGRQLSSADIEKIGEAISKIKNKKARISASVGELDRKALEYLKKCGLTRIHHNLETAPSFFPSVCTTHRFTDRVKTVHNAKAAGLEVCCGGIFGIGETPEQRIEFDLTLKDLNVDSIPMNFLNPIPGTPLASQKPLSCQEILRTIAVFRLILPDKDISICGGREKNLRDLQSWIFYAGANGMMAGGYLTTPGRSVEQDLQMIKDLGLRVQGERDDGR
jgi:biotin synthase